MLFWRLESGQISYFDIQNPILTFEMGLNIVFWHSNWGWISYFHIQNILAFKIGPNIIFWHFKPYFEMKNWDEYHILTFKILFWHSNWCRISYFDIQNPILAFKIGQNIVFWHSKLYFEIWNPAEYRILTFKIIFWYQNWAKCRILTFKTLFWHSNWGWISNFYIPNPIFSFEIAPNILSGHSKSYFDIQTVTKYCFLTFKILFWHLHWVQISNFDIQNPILAFKIGQNIVFWHSKLYFEIWNPAEYRVLTFKIIFGIRTEAKYHTLTFKILFWYWNQAAYCILTFWKMSYF